ncbi:MAG: alanine dehydrogenase [Proteobacteria bacterium]|nr:alanine dehydrogenase [Pseudomonadota bacterium]
MQIGVPKESKNHEYRVGMTPASVHELTALGHDVWVEADAGSAIGFSNQRYESAGARVVSRDQAYAASLIVKVKEPSLQECEALGSGQVLFCYLHLATARPQAHKLAERGVTAIAYETVTDRAGRLPLLSPMSEVAGRLSIQVGANALHVTNGGRGTLLGGVAGVAPAKVVILGGGMAGTNAAYMATGLQADVTVIDQSVERLRALSAEVSGRIKVLMASTDSIACAVRDADLVVGAVLVPGASTPKLVSRNQLSEMLPGAVLVDIAIDQGGAFESSRPTTHDNPTYIEQGIVHYCVTNMPGAVARTATQALNNVTLPYVVDIAQKGWHQALADNPGFAAGLNINDGQICHAAAAEALAQP